MKSKILTAALSFVIALGLWLYVVSVISPESEKTFYNIPVILQNESLLEERGLMVTTDKIPTVNLRLEGSRRDLDKLNNSNIIVVADVSGIHEAGNHQVNYTVSFPGDVPNRAITILKRTPDAVSLTGEERSSKTVKVRPDWTGVQEAGFAVDKENIELDVSEFQIVGPKRILDNVAGARILVNLHNRKESINNLTLSYYLVDHDGKRLAESDQAQVEDKLENSGMITVRKLRIVRVKEVSLGVQIIPGGGADSNNTSVKLDVPKITVSGATGLLETLGDELIVGTIELGKLTQNTQLRFPLQLPADITCESGETEVVVTVDFGDLRTKTLNITNIQPVKVPEGMWAEVSAKHVEIQFRGPAALIDALTAEDVTLTVDVSGIQIGTDDTHGVGREQVTIELPAGIEGVGAIGTYSVAVTLYKNL